MTIVIVAIGTRGDVQPLAALGLGLQARGHAVRLLVGANFRAWAESHGLTTATTGVDIQGMMDSRWGREWSEKGANPIRQLRAMQGLIDEFGWELAQDVWRACEGATAIIGSFTTDTIVASLAERLDVPQLSAVLQPAILATRDGAAALDAPRPNRISWLNYLTSHYIVEPVGWRLNHRIVNRLRREVLKLPRQDWRGYRAALGRALILCGYSRHIIPHPADWPPNVHTTGYWFFPGDEAWEPPAALADFLAVGPPPVYLGFGSMTASDPAQLTDLLVRATERSGQRAILLSGWAGLGDAALPPTIFPLAAAPHGWLFPRVAAVAHHGGAGTTAAGLRAGIPSVLIPHLGDQFHWGRRIAALGLGPAPIPRRALTAERLGDAIRQAASDPAMRRRTEEIGAKIRSEDGVGEAVALIEAFVAQEATSPRAGRYQ
jgi:UDP:flavonoid glycosyltransferase YjiC (YdhE family)